MDKATLLIRDFTDADLAATAMLFFESVQRGTTAHYTAEQRNAWVPAIPNPNEWRERLSAMDTWIAEADGKMVGFMSLIKSGHLDLAFVHPDWIGKGVAAQLYGRLETYAIDSGFTLLTCHASLLARPFFERQGWRVIAEQQPVRNGVALTNFRMEKPLP